MKKYIILMALLLCSMCAYADPTWTVYISTNPPNFDQSIATVVSSTADADIVLPLDPKIICMAVKPWYFQIPGIPYPLVQHRFFGCVLENNDMVATEVGCSLKQDDVQYANLLLKTSNAMYNITMNCANFVNDAKEK